MKLLRIVWIALLLAGALGFAIGTALRMRVERPRYYIGSAPARDPGQVAYTEFGSALARDPLPVAYTEIGSALARDPLDVGHARAAVLEARHYEEQIGEPV